MTTKNRQSFDIRFPVAFGSGLATALLFIGARQQVSLIAMLATFLSPLPIMIATLGFGHMTGLGAAIVGAVTCMALIFSAAGLAVSAKALIVAGFGGLMFALSLTLPSWWLARLAGAGRPQIILPWLSSRLRQIAGQRKPAAPSEATSGPFCPFGDVLFSAAAIVFAMASVIILAAILREPSYQASLAKAAAAIKPLIAETFGHRKLPDHLDLATLTHYFVHFLPAITSALVVFIFLANLWLAGRVVQLSHRLVHPWPDIAHELQVPRLMAPLFLICVGLAFLDNLGGMIAGIAAAVLGILFVLQGLAVLHDLSRGLRFRTVLLFVLYFALAVLVPWPLLVFLIIGLAEAGFSLRARKAAQELNNK